MTLTAAAALIALSACAPQSGSDGPVYASPNWTRERCWATDWRLQGGSDAARYADAEARFAALERNCAMHGHIDRDAYFEGFASAR